MDDEHIDNDDTISCYSDDDDYSSSHNGCYCTNDYICGNCADDYGYDRDGNLIKL